MLKVIACQYDIAWEDRAANFDRVRELLGKNGGGDFSGGLIVLPEMFATGFSMNLEATTEPEGAPAINFMRELASQHEAAVMGGFVTQSENKDKFGRNELRVVAPSGDELARYQKIRTFRYTQEFDFYERGREIVTFHWGGLKICPLICYDLRFPELFRRGVAHGGAEVFIVIASWPKVRAEHWVVLLRARAIENQAWVVGVNRSGSDPNWDYPGRSVVINPMGEIVADAGAEEGMLIAELDPMVVREWRDEFPALMDLEI
ncbi:MAG: carbon-nitrogen family hydrolase [Verrucomicrobiae bacterium]|nr:carbon-nitrogen family hydrolase [Verrucomicrobiae bacterium]